MNRSKEPTPTGVYRHEVVLYDGPADFLDKTVPFVSDAQSRDEAVLAILPDDRITALRAALGTTAGVQFLDMDGVGENPARIIPAWRDFVRAHATDGARVRGLGEPIWPGRDAPAIDESLIHESLVDVAFSDDPAFTLWCLYDRAALDADTIATVDRYHATVMADGLQGSSERYDRAAAVADPDDHPLAPVPHRARQLPVDGEPPVVVRRFVEDFAADVALDRTWTADLVLAVNEVVTNTMLYAPGPAWIALWVDEESVMCDVQDGGHITDPLVGRRRPSGSANGGCGLWIVNQLCNLVQIRSCERGTTVRIRLRSRRAGHRRRRTVAADV